MNLLTAPRAVIPATALKPKAPQDIMAELEKMTPGKVVIYHSGDLASERHESRSGAAITNAIAEFAYKLAQRGYAQLTQFRLPFGNFAYTATGTDPRNRRPAH